MALISSPITQDDIIYFIVTDRFFGVSKKTVSVADTSTHGGTLDGVLQKLDYLIGLGITAVWVTPVYENIDRYDSAEPYHYYWPKDFARIDQRLLDGSVLPNSPNMTTFGEFVDRCEQRGIKVILDMVVNHCGYGAEESFPPNFFNHGDGDVEGSLAGLPDFDHDNPEVTDFFIQNIKGWMTRGKVSNIRMDTAKHVEPKFWYYFKSLVAGEYPDSFMVGEILIEDVNKVNELAEYQNFHNFNSVFDFPLCSALRSALIYDEDMSQLLARPRLSINEPVGVLDNDNPLKGGYRNPNQLVTLLDNHDLEKRIISHARTKHAGNDGGLNFAIKVTKLCLGALFTMRGIPQLYYGTEIGLEGWKVGGAHGDRDLRRDFPWDVIGENHLPKDDLIKEKEIFQWTRDLIALRKNCRALRSGATITLWSDRFVYAFLRVSTDDTAFIIINNGYEAMQQPIGIPLNMSILPKRVIDQITRNLSHWQSGQQLETVNGQINIRVAGKTIDIYIAR